jgi:hypothetical protein
VRCIQGGDAPQSIERFPIRPHSFYRKEVKTMHHSTNLKSLVTLVAVCSLVGQSTATAASKPLELTWSEVGPRIQGKHIQLTLPGGATLRGEVAVVREDALVLDVKTTSDAGAYPKGSATIARASVNVLSMTETKSKYGRKLGQGLGTLAGVLAGGYVAGTTASSPGAGLAIFGGLAGAGVLVGYFLGRHADDKTTLILIVP